MFKLSHKPLDIETQKHIIDLYERRNITQEQLQQKFNIKKYYLRKILKGSKKYKTSKYTYKKYMAIVKYQYEHPHATQREISQVFEMPIHAVNHLLQLRRYKMLKAQQQTIPDKLLKKFAPPAVPAKLSNRVIPPAKIDILKDHKQHVDKLIKKIDIYDQDYLNYYFYRINQE